MFNEKSGKWIKVFKLYTQIMFFLFLAAGVALSIVVWVNWGSFLEGIACWAGGAFLAFTQLIANMLIIQLLNNVQTIREKLEEK